MNLQGIIATCAHRDIGYRDGAVEAALAKEADQWLGWDEQVNLPNFMRTPPPVFRIAPADKAIRAVAIGDFRTGSPAHFSHW